MQSILPKVKSNQQNHVLIVYLDSNLVTSHNFDLNEIQIPHFGGAWIKFLDSYSKFHGVKKSRNIDIERIKIKGSEDHLKFKIKNKPDKKQTLNKSKPKQIPPEVYQQYLSHFREVIEEIFLEPLNEIDLESIKDRKALQEIFRDRTKNEDRNFVMKVVNSQYFNFFLDNGL